MTPGVEITGLEQLKQRIRTWPNHVQPEVAERVLTEAARPIIAAVRRISKAELSKNKGRTHVWEKSIGRKMWPTKALREQYAVVMVIVGARRGKQYNDRANIAHLLEHGWRIAKGGTLERKGGRTAGRAKLTGERGKGIAIGVHPGFKIVEKAHAATEATVRSILSSRIPVIAKEVWEKWRA